MASQTSGGHHGGQPFTYYLFDALRPSEFERRGRGTPNRLGHRTVAGHSE